MTQNWKEKYPIGSVWVNGKGETGTVIINNEHSVYPIILNFSVRGNESFTDKGKYFCDKDSSNDLIKRIDKQEEPMTEKPIKLELYKAYKMRNGGKAVVVDQDEDGGFIAWVEDDDDTVAITDEGFYLSIEQPHPYDIISEWQETVTHTFWAMIYGNGELFTCNTISPPSSSSAKAIKKFTITEGEFDNDQ